MKKSSFGVSRINRRRFVVSAASRVEWAHWLCWVLLAGVVVYIVWNVVEGE